ncbi:HD-GYP domain-containing protein [Alloiococcus sp. CFN-8]|uniref:HD-GYP domain-containing protein n=1 Tax=Alloiococcus sp. CFN-8 TaxID=3416081 RepID=UPI003CF699EF
MRLVPLESIRDGCLLAKNIYDSQNRILLKEGAVLNSLTINKLREYNIFTLWVQDEYSDSEIVTIIKPQLREKSIKVLKDTFKNIDKFQSLWDGQSFFSPTQSSLCKDAYLTSVYKLSDELLDNIINNKNVMVSLVDIKSMDDCTYNHSINVALLSLVIGLGIQLPLRDLKDLCVGALIHDIGKVLIHRDIITKEGSLTSDEYTYVKKHTTKGFDYLRNVPSISTSVRLIALQHHERVDGLGYPGGLTRDEIHPLAKIVAVADVYDALTSHRPYRKALLPNEAMEYIMAHSGTIFDHNIVTVFSRVVVPYPSGTIVRLSNGDIGIVLDTPFYYPLRPDIRIIESKEENKIGKLVSLLKELSIVISDIIYAI